MAHGGDLTRKVRMAPQTLSEKSRTAARTKIIEESMPDWDLYGFQPQLAQSSYGEVLGSLEQEVGLAIVSAAEIKASAQRLFFAQPSTWPR